MHKDAQRAAEAAQCAHDQGKFWEYHDKLFDNQRALAAEQLKAYATEMGLNGETFNACLDSGKYRDEIRQDMREGQDIGVSGTPAFFINGRFLSGAQPYEAFASIIDEELERAGVSAP
jgi:protein-disulfide isomerase